MGKQSMQPSRWEVMTVLARHTGARSLAAIVTPTTSSEIRSRPEMAAFELHDFWYSSPEQKQRLPQAVGLDDRDTMLAALAASGLGADMVFVDSWHDYPDSLLTLEAGLAALNRGGWMIVHDCLPETIDLTDDLETGLGHLPWCGDTWRAFVDVAARLPSPFRSVVIDAEYGIGAMCLDGPLLERDAAPSPVPDLGREASFAWFQAHVGELVSVVTPQMWKRDPIGAMEGRPHRPWWSISRRGRRG